MLISSKEYLIVTLRLVFYGTFRHHGSAKLTHEINYHGKPLLSQAKNLGVILDWSLSYTIAIT